MRSNDITTATNRLKYCLHIAISKTFSNYDIDIDRAVLKYIDIDKEFRKISISILISIRRFRKISISIKYRID